MDWIAVGRDAWRETSIDLKLVLALGAVAVACFFAFRPGPSEVEHRREYAEELRRQVYLAQYDFELCEEEGRGECKTRFRRALDAALVLTNARFGYPIPNNDQLSNFTSASVRSYENDRAEVARAAARAAASASR